jgi:hypothetical protein
MRGTKTIEKMFTLDGIRALLGSLMVCLVLVASGASALEWKRYPNPAAAGDSLGAERAVGVHGDWLVIGAQYNDHRGDGAGAAYAYQWNGIQWVARQMLSASDASALDFFGASVAIHDDVIAVGATGSEKVYVFRYDGTQWVEEKILAAPIADVGFGHSVALDEDVLVTGMPDCECTIIQFFAEYSGALVIHRFDGQDWIPEPTSHEGVTADDGILFPSQAVKKFGYSVDISGDRIVAGAPDSYSFEYSDAIRTGAAVVLKRTAERWEDEEILYGPESTLEWARVGHDVAIDGDVVAIGMPKRPVPFCIPYVNGNVCREGGVQLYRRQDDLWTAEQSIWPTSGDDSGHEDFGIAVALSEGRLLIGASLENGFAAESGAAIGYSFDGSAWSQTHRLVDSDGSVFQSFGSSVAIWGKRMVVGAPGDDSAGANAGAFYVFEDFQCSDGVDHDEDGLVDLDDPDCEFPMDETEWHLSPGEILVTDNGTTPSLLRVDPTTGDQTVLATSPRFRDLYGVALNDEGDIDFADGAGRALYRLDPDFGWIDVLSQDGWLAYPRYFSHEAEGTIVVADSPTDGIHRIDPETGFQTPVARGPDLTIPIDVVVEESGFLVASDYASASLLRIHPQTGERSVLSSYGQLDLVWDLEIDDQGDFFLSDVGNDSLFHIDAVTGGQTSLTTFADVRGIALEEDGQVIVADPESDTLWRVEPESGLTVAISTGGELDFPMGLDVVPTSYVPEPDRLLALLAGIALLPLLSRGRCTGSNRRRA